jgi:ribosomal protein L29
MSKFSIELKNKTPNELGSLVMKLKLQLLENRFATAGGDNEKAKKNLEIKKLIAIALTLLRQKNYKVSIGVHGIALIDLTSNKTTYITEEVSAELNEKIASETIEGEKGTKKTKKTGGKEIKLEEFKNNDNKTMLNNIKNREKKAAIRKTQGGGQ